MVSVKCSSAEHTREVTPGARVAPSPPNTQTARRGKGKRGKRQAVYSNRLVSSVDGMDGTRAMQLASDTALGRAGCAGDGLPVLEQRHHKERGPRHSH